MDESQTDTKYSTPATLRPTFSASMFGDFLSPPVIDDCRQGHQADQGETHRRSFVLRLDQRLREQRESANQTSAETADHIVAQTASSMMVPDELDGSNSRSRGLELRPYHPLMNSVTCAVCSRNSMETPPQTHPRVSRCFCQERGSTTSGFEQCSEFDHRLPLASTPAQEESHWMQSEPTTRLSSDSPYERFVLQGPEESSILDLSMDEDLDEGQPGRRIHLRPKKNASRSNSASPAMSSPSSTSLLEETDFIMDFPTNVPNFAHFSGAPVALEPASTAAQRAAVASAPLLPVMSPEVCKPTASITALQQIPTLALSPDEAISGDNRWKTPMS